MATNKEAIALEIKRKTILRSLGIQDRDHPEYLKLNELEFRSACDRLADKGELRLMVASADRYR